MTPFEHLINSLNQSRNKSMHSNETFEDEQNILDIAFKTCETIHREEYMSYI